MHNPFVQKQNKTKHYSNTVYSTANGESRNETILAIHLSLSCAVAAVSDSV